jgi:hypothetical protein
MEVVLIETWHVLKEEGFETLIRGLDEWKVAFGCLVVLPQLQQLSPSDKTSPKRVASSCFRVSNVKKVKIKYYVLV